MRGKTLAAFALLAFVVGSVVFLVAKEWKRPRAVGAIPSGTSVPATSAAAGTEDASRRERPEPGPNVIAYYFHGNFRCVSCLKIEALSRKAVAEGFPQEVRGGQVVFRAVNVDDPQNRHFIEEYQLASQSLVIVEMRGGRQVRWQTLEKVWTLLDDESEFISYVREAVSGLLKSA